jgi:DNA repair photolyase
MDTTVPATRVHEYTLKGGITRTPEFERKKLACFAVNCGIACGHDCAYCSTKALLRRHKGFKECGESPFGSGLAIVDPGTPDRVAKDAKKIRNRGLIQLCTVVDAWAPEAQQHQIGRRCLQAILAEPGWSVRILTKNAAVRNDFDLIEQHRDRVFVGLSLTATPEKGKIMEVLEPNASPIEDRTLAMIEATARGLRTYAMLCPLLPGIADSPDQIDRLVRLAVEFRAEEIFAEPINPRGRGLRRCQEALELWGYEAEAKAIGAIRKQVTWSAYVVDLIRNVQQSVRQHSDIAKLRFLLYPSRLLPEHVEAIKKDDAGVIWLGKQAGEPSDLQQPILPMPGLFEGKANADTQ